MQISLTRGEHRTLMDIVKGARLVSIIKEHPDSGYDDPERNEAARVLVHVERIAAKLEKAEKPPQRKGGWKR